MHSECGYSDRVARVAPIESTFRRWEVRHEGAPQRGKGMAELPVAVRTVSVSRCGGEHVPNFWQVRRQNLHPAVMRL